MTLAAGIKQLLTGLFLVPALAFGAQGAAEDIALRSERLITVGGGVTEIINALGLSQDIVATDITSHVPPRVDQLPKIGYQRQLSSEGLLSLKPDHLIGTDEMGPPTVLKQLEQAGVKVTVLPAGTQLSQLEERINILSDITGKPEEGKALWSKVSHDLAAAKEASGNHGALKAVFMMSHSGTSLLAGKKTTVNSLIEMVGASNPAADSFDGYRPVSSESLFLMAPDVIIVSQSTVRKEKDLDAILELMPGLEATPAGRKRQVFIIDGSVIQGGLGPRIGEVALKLAKQIYQTELTAKP